MGLNWHTDEDKAVWEGDAKRPHPWLPPPRWRTLVGLLLLVVTAVLFGRQWGDYTAEQEQQLIAEVEASYHLLARASQHRDLELLRLVLSGRDSGWSYEQQRHLLQGQLLMRPFVGWTHLPSQEQVEIHLSNNWQEASLTIIHSYQTDYALLPLVRLRQQVYFERGATRWLYAPPPDGWGGEPEQINGRWLTTRYPAVDAPFAHALHATLEDSFGRYCAELGRLCPPNAHINLTLTSNPANLSTLFTGHRAETSNLEVELPTPSLIGQPVDEASQHALYGQYAAHLLIIANHEWVVGRRIFAEPLDMVLMDAQLRQLGLPPQLRPAQPLLPAFYDELLDYEGMWSTVSLPYEEQMTSRARQLLGFLEPLTAEHTPLELQRLLSQPSFTAWLEQSTGLALWQIERAWEQYVYEQTAVPTHLPPPPYPTQVASLLCTQSNQAVQYVTISHWDETPQWSASNTLGSAARYQYTHWPLPADDGFVWQQMPLDPAENSWYSLLVYDDGQGFHLFDASNWRTPIAYTGLAHPSGRPLVMTSADPELGFTQYHLLDPAQCTAEGCPMTTSRGLPVWSPTGTHTLLTSFRGLHLGDRVGERLERLEQGTLPFWLAADWYGYLRPLRLINDGGVVLSETAVVLARLDEGQGAGREEVLTAADILAAIPPTSLPDPLRYRTARPLIDHVLAHPHEASMVVVLHLHGQSERYMIKYEPAHRQGQLLWTTTAEIGQLFFSPSGRWLTLTTFAPTPTGLVGQVVAHDWQTARTYLYTAELGHGANTAVWRPDWSADEQWLLFTDDQSAHLAAPLHNHRERLFHTYLACAQAAWLNQ